MLQQALHEVETSSIFLKFSTIAATLQRIFEALHSVTPLLRFVSQCFVQSANKNTPSTFKLNPRSRRPRRQYFARQYFARIKEKHYFLL